MYLFSHSQIGRIIPRYVRIGCFCFFIFFVCILSCVVFGRGSCTLLTTGQGGPPIISVSCMRSIETLILRLRDKGYQGKFPTINHKLKIHITHKRTLLSEHWILKAYHHTLKITWDPSCACGGGSQTAHHLRPHCKLYNKERMQLRDVEWRYKSHK